MEIKQIGTGILAYLKKYRYAVIVLIVGLLLMTIPARSSQKSSGKDEVVQPVESESIEEQLSRVLCQIRGVGRVEVMLAKSSGPENIYQTDIDKSDANASETEQRKTVIIKDSDRNEIPLIRYTIPSRYLGAIIVCDGADDPRVRLALIDAVCKITGLGSDSVSIVKMK